MFYLSIVTNYLYLVVLQLCKNVINFKSTCITTCFTLQLDLPSLAAQWVQTCTSEVWHGKKTAEVVIPNHQLFCVAADLLCRPVDDNLTPSGP